ncbi:MAG: hypothetical protein QUT30_08880 [Acidobacteriota bacterium]|nr:hypothetical protein [Acidobacteriota bacterium]
MKTYKEAAVALPDLDSAVYPSAVYAGYVVAVLYLTYTFSFIDRAIILYLVGPIRADLQINDFQFSLIQGLASLHCR